MIRLNLLSELFIHCGNTSGTSSVAVTITKYQLVTQVTARAPHGLHSII